MLLSIADRVRLDAARAEFHRRAEQTLEDGTRVDFGRHGRRAPPGNAIAEYAQLYPESQLPTRRPSSQPSSIEANRVLLPMNCAATWSTEMPHWISAPAVFRDARRSDSWRRRERGLRDRRRARARYCEPAGHQEHLSLTPFERLQRCAAVRTAYRRRRRPVLHDDAVRHVHEGHARGSFARRVAANAGVIASSTGSATAAPRPRRKVRRGRCFRVIMIFRSFSSAASRNGMLSTIPSPARRIDILQPLAGG